MLDYCTPGQKESYGQLGKGGDCGLIAASK